MASTQPSLGTTGVLPTADFPVRRLRPHAARCRLRLAMVTAAGFTVQATLYAIYGATFLAVIQHANIRTPPWMGYIFQRPESHSLHHEKGVHAFNYSDLPLFDLLFGTFRNPKEFSKETGFYDGASCRIVDMLLFRDINR